MTPDVTVVIPTRDRWGRLQRTLASALVQRDVRVESVVVDDGSVDGTAAGLRAMAESDPRVRTVRHDQPQGLARARNAGIRAAGADWVAFLDDDDVWAPDKLCRQLAAATRNDTAWAYAGVVVVDEELRVTAVEHAGDPAAVLDRLLVEPWVPAGASNVIARTDLLRQLDGFDDALAHLADWDLWIRLAREGPPATVAEPLLAYVQHGSNMHLAANIDDSLRELGRLKSKHQTARLERGLELDERAFAHWVTSGHRGAGRHWRASLVHLRVAAQRRDAAELTLAARAVLSARWLRPQRTAPPIEAPSWLANLAPGGPKSRDEPAPRPEH